jgi:hypothetical protein
MLKEKGAEVLSKGMCSVFNPTLSKKDGDKAIDIIKHLRKNNLWH